MNLEITVLQMAKNEGALNPRIEEVSEEGYITVFDESSGNIWEVVLDLVGCANE